MPTGIMPIPLGTSKLLTLIQAAALLEPHLGGVNPINWLADTRRAKAHYRDLSVRAPVPAIHNRRLHYTVEEIERVIEELRAAKKAA
jgi:hypothetical protein